MALNISSAVQRTMTGVCQGGQEVTGSNRNRKTHRLLGGALGAAPNPAASRQRNFDQTRSRHPAWRRLSPSSHGSPLDRAGRRDRKSTRLNSSHVEISYAVFCLKKKKKT